MKLYSDYQISFLLSDELRNKILNTKFKLGNDIVNIKHLNFITKIDIYRLYQKLVLSRRIVTAKEFDLWVIKNGGNNPTIKYRFDLEFVINNSFNYSGVV